MPLGKRGFQKGHTGHWNGKKFSPEHCRNIGLARLGKISPMKGKTYGEDVRKKMSESAHKRFENKENHPRWIRDRTQLQKKQERNDYAYQEWVNRIKKRDGQCKLKNDNCSGYLIVHHILGWKDYPEERYNLGNGITLCQAHHPRKRVEEKRLVPVFQGIIINN